VTPVYSLDHVNAIRAAEIDRVAPFFPSGARILEIGAGTGQQARALQQRGFQVTAIELADSTYSAHRVFPITDYDGAVIPLSDASVDVAYSSNVLEHVPNLAQIHSETRRVLAPRGICIHVLPTHAWRFWTTLASYPDALVYLAAGLPQLVPRSLPRSPERRRLATAWYTTARRVGGRLLPRRHGERGNVISETWLFHPSWWRRNFADNGFVVVHDEPMGLFYTGNMLLGMSLSVAKRQRLAQILGSACHLFKLVPASE
jgi:SAM-dependent methyltransferase